MMVLESELEMRVMVSTRALYELHSKQDLEVVDL
jgi:hypothetical protein